MLTLAALAAYERFPRGATNKVEGQGDVLASDLARYHDHSFTVTRVIDGDTLDIDNRDRDFSATRVRLWGIDCPETEHDRTEGMYFGREAAAFTMRTLQSRSVHLLLSPKQTRDRHGRLLAYVLTARGGPMFNEILVEQGYAYADRRFPHHYSERFEAAEGRAKRDKLGLWGNVQPSQTPAWYRRMVLGGQ